ncbi:hypothetical protein [Parasitella parasitica]|uniref:Major facilitator superfamily (MFS) profile domain-containing protein n=1 Tax=Parasitella parasitica TaxID=35722 RepID=A0A0B7MZ10_9FUNG|nr:hypothetical protein [Parasitella parasitica]
MEQQELGSKDVSNQTSWLAWIELACVVLLNMSINLRWLTFSPVASIAAEYLDVNISAITWLSNCATLIYIAICVSTGWVFERYGMKTCFLLAAATNILGSWIRYFGTFAPVNQRYPVIMFGQCIASIAEPFIMNIGTHFAAVWFATHHRVTANTLQALPLGMIVATLSMPKLVTSTDDMPRALLITSCISSAFGIPFLFLPSGPKVPPTESSRVSRTTFRKSLKIMLKSKNYLLLIFVFSINFAMFASIVSITSLIFTPQGYTNVQVGLFSFVRIISGVGGAIVAGRISDWTGRHSLVLKVACCMTVVTTVILYVQELAAECTFPVSESVSASVLWLFSQVSSFVTTFIMDALRAGPDASPPNNMKNALIYAIVLACCGAVPALFLQSDLKRIRRDRNAIEDNQKDQSCQDIQEISFVMQEKIA